MFPPLFLCAEEIKVHERVSNLSLVFASSAERLHAAPSGGAAGTHTHHQPPAASRSIAQRTHRRQYTQINDIIYTQVFKVCDLYRLHSSSYEIAFSKRCTCEAEQ